MSTHDEQTVVIEMAQSHSGSKLLTDTYLRHLNPAASMLTGKSENIPLVAEAVYYRQAKTNSDITASTLRLLAWFDKQRRTWMGSETNSTIYGPMYVCAVAGIAARASERNDVDLMDECRAWLGFYFALCEACRDPLTGTILQVGNRSADRDPAGGQVWAGYLCSVAAVAGKWNGSSPATIGPPSAWTAAAKRLGLAPARSWITLSVQPEPIAAVLRTAYVSRASCGSWGLLSPIHVLRWPNGTLAVYLESSGNGNTFALLAAVVSHTGTPVFSYLPPNGGALPDKARIREQFDHATCHIDVATSILIYSSTILALAPPNGTASIKLPPIAEATETVFGLLQTKG